MPARFPIAGSTACSSPARSGRPASASSTRRWCSRPRSATPSRWAPRRGGSKTSPTTACSSRRRPASRARCRSGTATRRAVRSNWAYAIGKLVRELGDTPKPAAIARLTEHHGLDRLAAENVLQLSRRAGGGRRRPRRSHHRHRALPRRARRLARVRALAARQPHPRAVGDGGDGARPQPHRRGRGSDVGRRRLRRPLPRDRAAARSGADAARPRRDRRRWCCGSSDRPRSSPRDSARRRPGRCCCRGGARASERRSSCSGSGHRICWRSRRDSDRFPPCSRPTAKCCAITSTCPALVDVLRQVGTRARRVTTIDSKQPSPFAASLLFSYVANYIYDGDAPLAERRAQALSVDQAQLRELLGDAELRDLLDPDALAELERRLQHLEDGYKVRSADGIHDLLIRIGDLTLEEIVERVGVCRRRRRRVGRTRAGAADRAAAGRRRAALRRGGGRGALPRRARRARCRPGCPKRCSSRCAIAAGDLAMRFARSHGPFTAGAAGRALRARHRGGRDAAAAAHRGRTAHRRRVPARRHRARVGRRQRAAQPAPPLAREAAPRDRGRRRRRARPLHGGAGMASARSARGLEALLDAIEQLQGAAMPASVLERDILPARVADYTPGDARHADGGRRGGVGGRSSGSASATAASRSTSPTISRACVRP